MATINLGSIKFKWQGAYAGGTAYTVDDVVSYQGSSYICIQASTGNLPTNATYFEQMSSAGTNGTDGTDLTTTLTTQGDIVYRDASGLARLGAGTSGKVLTTKGSGQNPAWETAVGGKILQVVTTIKSDTASWSSTQLRTDTGLQATITPSATSSKILINYLVGIGYHTNCNQFYIHMDRNGTEIAQGDAATGRKRAAASPVNYAAINESYIVTSVSGCFLDTPSSTSALTYKVQHSGVSTSSDAFYLNRSYDDRSNTGYDARTSSNIILMEVGA